jgi:D-tyrosyl-tRNA(Tyr) deacylase
MRATLQRVKRASVHIDGKEVSGIDAGWLCLIGLSRGYTPADGAWIARKLLSLRCWPCAELPEKKPWHRNVQQIQGKILLVSQFTLYADLKRTRPDFRQALSPSEAKVAYQAFVDHVSDLYGPQKVHDGVFGAHMDVSLVNDGPVTFTLDSKDKPPTKEELQLQKQQKQQKQAAAAAAAVTVVAPPTTTTEQ